MANSLNSYGDDHREARKRKIKEVREREGQAQCEVTGAKDNLQAHHGVPKLFNGPDHESNYQLLQGHFHQQVLHAICNVTDREKVHERTQLTRELMRNILDEVKSQDIHNRIKHLDDHLIEEYIFNMLNKMQHHYREKVLHLTLVNSFKTIRDLNIENVRLKKQLEAINAQSQVVLEEE